MGVPNGSDAAGGQDGGGGGGGGGGADIFASATAASATAELSLAGDSLGTLASGLQRRLCLFVCASQVNMLWAFILNMASQCGHFKLSGDNKLYEHL